MKVRQFFTAFCSFLLFVLPVMAQNGPEGEDFGPKPTKQAESDKRDAENKKAFKDNPDVLVLPGLVANKKTKRVEVLAEVTPVSKEDAVEFLVVYTKSSHGYEAFMWSYAKPSDIQKGLEFIGVPAGAPYYPQAMQFWPKGERVVASIEDDGGNAVRLEELIYDKVAEESLPPKGYIFTGSIIVPDPKDPTKKIYFADAYDPRAVIAGFNSSGGVLEPSWTISKGEAYQTYQIHPESDFGDNELYTLLLEPESKDGKLRVRNLDLTIKDRQTFILKDEKGKEIAPENTVKAALTKCLEILKGGQEPYVTLHFDGALSLGEIYQVSSALAMLDQPAALRIDPPSPGELYYRSFLAPERWRNADERMSQSWEVHIKHADGGLSSDMIYYEEIWKEGQMKPDLKKHEYQTPTPADVRKRLDDDAAEREKNNERYLAPVLFVYAPADISYTALLNYLAPVLKTHKTIHLYLTDPAMQP